MSRLPPRRCRGDRKMEEAEDASPEEEGRMPPSPCPPRSGDDHRSLCAWGAVSSAAAEDADREETVVAPTAPPPEAGTDSGGEKEEAAALPPLP